MNNAGCFTVTAFNSLWTGQLNKRHSNLFLKLHYRRNEKY